MTRIQELLRMFLQNECSESERLELFRLVDATGDDELKMMVEEAWNRYSPTDLVPEDVSERVVGRILGRRERPTVVRLWVKWAVAASVVTALGLGYFLFFDKGVQNAEEVVAKVEDDVKAPASNFATITLADGRIVYLDSVSSGQLAVQDKVKLIKLADGRITYDGSAGMAVYNTLTNPRGSKVIDMTLSDGSRVWLNAGSSVTYPVAFVGRERKVEITGEAYFEVVHDASKPFFVNNGDVSVQVLGTHFNVNAYDDEAAIRVTLLEGSVRVTHDGNGAGSRQEAIIQPGEQAVVSSTRSTPVSVTKDVNVDEVMAWKNGLFSFSGASIETILKEISRYYDAAIVYQDSIPGQFVADISRDVPVSKLLHILELTNRVHFKIEGKRITVMK